MTPLRLIPSTNGLPGSANAELSVQLTGGTSNGFTILSVRQSFNINDEATNASNISLYTVQYPSNDSIKIIRNATPCSYPISDCELVIRGMDSSGELVSLGLPIY